MTPPPPATAGGAILRSSANLPRGRWSTFQVVVFKKEDLGGCCAGAIGHCPTAFVFHQPKNKISPPILPPPATGPDRRLGAAQEPLATAQRPLCFTNPKTRFHHQPCHRLPQAPIGGWLLHRSHLAGCWDGNHISTFDIEFCFSQRGSRHALVKKYT